MKVLKNVIFPTMILFISISHAQNNLVLQKMADEDQKARMAGGLDWETLIKQDSLRRVKVYELLAENRVKTAKDYFNAGIIFQHGNDTIASKMAVTCFEKAINMDSSLNRWWYAAAVDRDLMRRDEPQIYGTQYIGVKDDNGAPVTVQYKMDTTKITDKERQYYYVPTLAEQKSKNKTLNLKSISFFYSNSEVSINEVVELIKAEFKKDEKAEYNVSEAIINMFGYNLMNTDKLDEALKIFKLNTELYPESANTYDSYGECLLKLGKKEKAKVAYEKALELNPENKNAEEIINKL